MAEESTGQENDNAAAGEVRSQLAKRLAVAGVLVAILLGVLAFFDYLANPSDDADQAVFTQPVPVAPKKEVSQPVKPTDNIPEPPAAEKSEAASEPPPPPVVEAQPAPVAEAKPEASAEPRPAVASRPAPSKGAPAHIHQAPPAVQTAPVPEGTTAPNNLPPPRVAPPAVEAPPPKFVARPAEPKAAAPVPAPVVSRLFSGFILQAGVFSSAQRAEELHAKLTLSGVPSTLETRVQVGPFRTKQEAEAAQAKLKELGVETILVPPKGKN